MCVQCVGKRNRANCLAALQSGVTPANQTKERPIRKPVREFGCFCEFGGFFLEKTRRIHKNQCSSRIWGVFVNSPCLFQEKHSEFTKTPQICEPACELAFLWFGLPGRLLTQNIAQVASFALFGKVARLEVQEMCLVSHYSAISDTISCDAPANSEGREWRVGSPILGPLTYSAIGFRAKLFLRCPPPSACLWTAIGHLYRKKWGCSSDSLRHHRKHSATGVLLHLSRDRGVISVGSLRRYVHNFSVCLPLETDFVARVGGLHVASEKFTCAKAVPLLCAYHRGQDHYIA